MLNPARKTKTIRAELSVDDLANLVAIGNRSNMCGLEADKPYVHRVAGFDRLDVPYCTGKWEPNPCAREIWKGLIERPPAWREKARPR